MPQTQLPTLTSYVDQNWFLEPLKGPKAPSSYLERFPEEVYNTGPDSRLTKFMYVLLGPSGVGFLRQNALEARLALEEMGLELFDLDLFYGEPLRFTRVTEEVYDEDPNGLIDRESWDAIRARDAQYRSRVLDFLDGARAGNTPLGMAYVARSGLGHEVAIIENYRALFDERSDDTLDLDHYGKTRFLEEMIVLPRREVQLSEVQVVTITGSPDGGTLVLVFNGETTDPIAWDAPAQNVQTFLEDLPSIQPGDVEVTGGPGPDIPWRIRFMGRWSARNTPQIRSVNSLTGGTDPQIQSTTVQSGVDVADEVAYISPSDQHHLIEAIDRIRPQIVIPTIGEAPGLRSRQLWQTSYATSEYDEVVRYVTGNPNVAWPGRDTISWIEASVEHQAPKPVQQRQYHYVNYHNIVGVAAFTEEAVEDPDYGDSETLSIMEAHKSEHIGPFNEIQRLVFPFLGESSSISQFTSDMATADYAEPLTVQAVVQDGTDTTLTQLVNNAYPIEYVDLPGVPSIQYAHDQFWSSKERVEGTEYLEIDLGSVQAINTIQFEITQKPTDIEMAFERLDQSARRIYEPVRINTEESSNTSISFAPENQNPWSFVEYNFNDVRGGLIFTRYLRIGFTRRNNSFSPFTIEDNSYYPWSIDVRNLRVGRNITNLV